MKPLCPKNSPSLTQVAGNLAFALIVLTVTGCENIYVGPKCSASGPSPLRETVYVSNPELEHEYRILRASKIYQLTSDPNCTNCVTLHPLSAWACGNPMLATGCTLWTVPVRFPGRYAFCYDLKRNDSLEHWYHPLPVFIRFSLWEALLKPFHNETHALATALARSSSFQSPNVTSGQTIQPRQNL